MMKIGAIALCLVGGACLLVESAKFPSTVEKCKAGDTECLIRVSNKVIRESSGSGHPGLNLPPIDPLKVDRIDIEQGNNSPVNINLHFRNVFMTGLSKLEIYSMQGFDRNISSPKEIKAKLTNGNKLVIDADYTISGRILLLPIAGEGKCNLVFHDWDGGWKMQSATVTKNNKEYLKVDKSRLVFSISRMQSNFENLFNGEKELSDTMNAFLNENWSEITEELRPALSDAISQILANIFSGPFSKIPYNQFFEE